MLRNGLAEGLAGLRVGRRLVECPAGDADRARRDVDSSELQSAHRHVEALARHAADQVPLGVQLVVLEDQLGGVDAVVAELFQLASRAESRVGLAGVRIGLGRDEHGHAPARRRGVRVGLDQQRHGAAFDAVADPGLGAVDAVAVPAGEGPGADALQVSAGVRLGQR